MRDPNAGWAAVRGVDFELTTKRGDAFWYFPYLIAIPTRWPRNARRKSNLDYDRQSLANAGLAASVVVAAAASPLLG